MTFELAAVQIWTRSPTLFLRYYSFYAPSLGILNSRKSWLNALLGAWTMFPYTIRTRACIAQNVWLRNRQLISIFGQLVRSRETRGASGWSSIDLGKLKCLWLWALGISAPHFTKPFSLLVEQWGCLGLVLERQYFMYLDIGEAR